MESTDNLLDFVISNILIPDTLIQQEVSLKAETLIQRDNFLLTMHKLIEDKNRVLDSRKTKILFCLLRAYFMNEVTTESHKEIKFKIINELINRISDSFKCCFTILVDICISFKINFEGYVKDKIENQDFSNSFPIHFLNKTESTLLRNESSFLYVINYVKNNSYNKKIVKDEESTTESKASTQCSSKISEQLRLFNPLECNNLIESLSILEKMLKNSSFQQENIMILHEYLKNLIISLSTQSKIDHSIEKEIMTFSNVNENDSVEQRFNHDTYLLLNNTSLSIILLILKSNNSLFISNMEFITNHIFFNKFKSANTYIIIVKSQLLYNDYYLNLNIKLSQIKQKIEMNEKVTSSSDDGKCDYSTKYIQQTHKALLDDFALTKKMIAFIIRNYFNIFESLLLNLLSYIEFSNSNNLIILRKISCELFTKLSQAFSTKVYNVINPYLEARYLSNNWKEKEATIVFLSILIDYNLELFKPQISCLFKYLIDEVNNTSNNQVLVSTAIWTLTKIINKFIDTDEFDNLIEKSFILLINNLSNSSFKIVNACCQSIISIISASNKANKYLIDILWNVNNISNEISIDNYFLLIDLITFIIKNHNDICVKYDHIIKLIFSSLIRKILNDGISNKKIVLFIQLLNDLLSVKEMINLGFLSISVFHLCTVIFKSSCSNNNIIDEELIRNTSELFINIVSLYFNTIEITFLNSNIVEHLLILGHYMSLKSSIISIFSLLIELNHKETKLYLYNIVTLVTNSLQISEDQLIAGNSAFVLSLIALDKNNLQTLNNFLSIISTFINETLSNEMIDQSLTLNTITLLLRLCLHSKYIVTYLSEVINIYFTKIYSILKKIPFLTESYLKIQLIVGLTNCIMLNPILFKDNIVLIMDLLCTSNASSVPSLDSNFKKIFNVYFNLFNKNPNDLVECLPDKLKQSVKNKYILNKTNSP